MAVQFIASATGTTSAVLPAHQADDAIVIFAYSGQVAVTPTAPAGFSVINSGSGNSNGHVVAIRRATSGAEISDTWTNAERLTVEIYRGVDWSRGTIPGVGGNALFTNVADVTYPAITMLDATGSSWVLGIHGRRVGNSDNVATPPGMILRADTGLTGFGRINAFDTETGVTTWPAKVSGGTNTFRYRSVSVELLAAGTAPPSGSVGAASGASTVVANGASSVASVASATATGIAQAIGASIISATGIAAGFSTAVAAVGSGSIASAIGASVALAVGARNAVASGIATGLSVATGAAIAVRNSVGLSVGSSLATAIATLTGSVANAQGASNAVAYSGEAVETPSERTISIAAEIRDLQPEQEIRTVLTVVETRIV